MKPESIWELSATSADLTYAASFASTTLPWTFNRMFLNTSPKGQKTRALNIVKGIVAQEMMRRKLEQLSVKVKTDNSYRKSDMFDFLIKVNGKFTKIDLKTFNYYNNYAVVGREKLTKKFICSNENYSGPDWRNFFPMLMPHTQILQDKEAYCFGIADSIDFRDSLFEYRKEFFLSAFPYGDCLPFFSSVKLCKERENNNKGIYLRVDYHKSSLFSIENTELEIIGEWAGKPQNIKVKFGKNNFVNNIGPFSIIASFKMAKSDFDNFDGKFDISISKNDYKAPILNTARKNINTPPDVVLEISKTNFCNLMLPYNFKLYMIGWILKDEFLKRCKKYPAYVWPKDSVNKFENQPWNQITDNDKKAIERAGFSDCLESKPRKFNAGWLKTNGKGGGTCCYVFPNIGRYGGVKETNLYVLIKDLKEMDKLKDL